jgi:hypothetical protein
VQKQTRTDEMEVRRTFTTALLDGAMPSLTRADFFRDPKKVAKKQDRPSRPDQERR